MSKKTILIALSLITIVGMISAVSIANAHNPELVEAWYERNTWSDDPGVQEYFEEDTIFVIFTHDVTDPTVHYIERVEIEVHYLNGSVEIVVDQHYTEQTHYSMFEYHYPGIDLVFGDEIHVTAYCNFDGSFSTHMTVGIPFDQHEVSFIVALAPSIVITILILIPIVYLGVKDFFKQKRAVKSALVNA